MPGLMSKIGAHLYLILRGKAHSKYEQKTLERGSQITLEKVEKAIRSLKENKGQVKGGICTEMLKWGGFYFFLIPFQKWDKPQA